MTSWRQIFSHFCLIAIVGIIGCQESPPVFETFPKIDAHVHIGTKEVAFVEQAMKDRFQVLTITTRSSSIEHIERQLECAIYQKKQFPNWVAFTTTFSMEDWTAPDWQTKTIQKLKQDFDSGAVAVKVWKDIGMTFRDDEGNFIMIDDPIFDPILDFIASEGKPLFAHIAEPRNCWLPLDSMTVSGDINYFRSNPQYHMYLHPEYPSHGEIMAARDRMLAKHPDLNVIGCHLGSLEWDVEVLAKTLDQYPNFAVDLAARICHLQIQDRDKVRNFLIKYQDRILYGTDLGAGDGEDSATYMHQTWWDDWQYFSTSIDTLKSPHFNQQFQGLKLPKSVLKRIYHDNANKWIPELFAQ